jgi:hypothetical protein
MYYIMAYILINKTLSSQMECISGFDFQIVEQLNINDYLGRYIANLYKYIVCRINFSK